MLISLVLILINSLQIFALECPTEKDFKCTEFWDKLTINHGENLLDNSTRNCFNSDLNEPFNVNVSIFELEVKEISEIKKVIHLKIVFIAFVVIMLSLLEILCCSNL